MLKKKVLVAMSGGVDSSMAAALLLEQGYEVVGVCMHVWDYSSCNLESGKGSCCSTLDVEDARKVCAHLKVPFYVSNCEAKFKTHVIDPFIKDYLSGRTPIACTNCNTYLKFHHLYEKMQHLGCDYLATGHYITKQKSPSGELGLYTSADKRKDQSYFLFTLKPHMLERLLFPVGGLEKTKLRRMARERNLPVAEKKDSTGLCFLASSKPKDFIDAHAKVKKPKGLLKLYPTGEVLGKHDGIHAFTYGQRRGLMGAQYLARGQNMPVLYVIKIEPSSGTVWLGTREHLYSQQACVKNINWLTQETSPELDVKIRFQHQAAPAAVVELSPDKTQCRLRFKQPQRSITPGQAAVFYKNHRLVGGGWLI